LGQPRKIGLSEHQSDVGVGDEVPGAVEHISLASVADLDALDHIPDELEIDIGHSHHTRLAARAHRDCHVWLAFFPEIHRPVPDLARLRVEEGRILRAVLGGAGDVHPQARHRQQFFARSVELRHVGHCRYLAQQLEKLYPAQLDATRAQLRQRREAKLLLDLANELLDS